MVKIKPLKTRVCQACGMSDLDINILRTPSFLQSTQIKRKTPAKIVSIINTKARKTPSKMSSLF
jgi:hypothetical protein